MRAPRARAASHSSSTTKPAPSPSRKPLRVASNGRLARCGVVVVGRHAPTAGRSPRGRPGLIIESKPPASARSTAPRRISFSAVPIAWPPDAHAVCTDVA